MNKKYLTASGAVALALLTATPALAETNGSIKADGHMGLGLGSITRFLDNHKDGEKDKREKRDDDRKHASSTKEHGGKSGIVGTVSAISGSTISVTGKDGVIYTVNASTAVLAGTEGSGFTLADIKVGDKLNVRGTVSGTTVVATKIVDSRIRTRNFLDAIGAVGAGVVSSISGSTFTVKPVGSSSTTTVSTNASTTYRVNGSATTSSALSVGSHVLLFGTTTGDTSLSASFVSIFTHGLGYLKQMFTR